MVPEKVPRILSTPKPTTFQHYLEQNTDTKGQLKHWNTDALISGHKFYWHRDNPEWTETGVAGSQHTLIKPVRPGVFTGRIRFTNLSEVELGALLFVLDLPENCYHKMGMGKPHGLGSIKIKQQLVLIDREKRYDSLFTGFTGDEINWNLADSVSETETFKKAFENYVLDRIPAKEKEEAASLWDTKRLRQLKVICINEVQAVVFNVWVKGIEPKTGNNFTSCIITCSAPRNTFETFNLYRVIPKECIRSLKGIFASTLAELAPVKPIMEINRDDKRFVESRNILSNLDETNNLAAMPWEDFEHLVMELFEKIFSKDGAEVRVTQASRDGGVDAIVYDPDPIKGGKFVIQAKRYNNVVPVSAVRDLFGTMMNEGAVKGILVTTSYYGSDSREFAKDKILEYQYHL